MWSKWKTWLGIDFSTGNMYIIEVKLFYIINGLVHFQNKNVLIIYSPQYHPKCACLSLFSRKEIFWGKHYRHFLHIVDLNVANGLKVQIADLMQLQRTLHDPSQGIRVLYSRKICHFLKQTNKKSMYVLFNHKCSSCTSSTSRIT